ncbi:MAG: stage II sporulation protein P [Oscillospiraceae bacterium]|jgi:stage II sporulation protein P|nr:stage II sporulation protein P [Oscillospiraceae bacterium]
MRNKLKMIGVCLIGMAVSPFLASLTVKGIEGISAVKDGFLDAVSVGADPYSDDVWERPGEGYGWEEETLPTYNFDSVPEEQGEKPYPEESAIPDENAGKILKITYGKYFGGRYFDLDGGGQVNNLTSLTNYSLKQESNLPVQFRIEMNSTPQVLIMHTHTTESFEPFERDVYDKTFNYRTTDPAKNVVMVGEEIKKQLEDAGIAVIHDTAVHDYPSYNGSYNRSAETVKAVLAREPGIKVVLDIHRDGISKPEGLAQPTVEIDGRKAAQVMLISGCDNGKLNMPDFLQNFRFASVLQKQMESDNPGITRPVLFDYRKYNQDLTTGSLLIEVGSHGNTLEQARYSGELIGKSIALALSNLQ